MVAGSRISGSSSGRPRRKRRVGLSAYQERLLKEALRDKTCSEPWVEAQFQSVVDVDDAGKQILYRFHDTRQYPPGEKSTLMVRCKVCGIFNPPNAMERGQCLDHAELGSWGPSPSALAISAMQMFNLRMEESALEPEDSRSLRNEIRKARKRALLRNGLKNVSVGK